jgi:hypothetical protein
LYSRGGGGPDEEFTPPDSGNLQPLGNRHSCHQAESVRAFFYNTLGISLAIAGILNPILAAAAMLLSSVSVIGNSLRLANRKSCEIA